MAMYDSYLLGPCKAERERLEEQVAEVVGQKCERRAKSTRQAARYSSVVVSVRTTR